MQYGMKNLSPTIGMIIYPDDYLKFCTHLHKYTNMQLEFISFEKSKYYESVVHRKEYPIARLDDIELHFLHYHSQKEAELKWERRIKRICWDCVIYKFNDQNGCTKEMLQRFCSLPLANKLCFVCKRNWIPGTIAIKGILNKNEIKFSYEPYGHNRQFNVTEYLNNI